MHKGKNDKCSCHKHDVNDENTANSNEESENNEKSVEDILNDLQNENKALKSNLLLAMADAENLRKRFDKEREDLMKYSVSKFAAEVLHIMDNVDRAIDNIPDSETFKNIKDGMMMNRKEILNILSRNKIEKININPGDEFNPHEHQAMMEEENDQFENGTISKVLQEGYKLHERVLRPTMVSVVKNK